METAITVPLKRIRSQANRKIAKEQQATLNASIAARIKAGMPPLIVPLGLQKTTGNAEFDYVIADGRCRYQGLVANGVTEVVMGGLEPMAVLVSGDPELVAFLANEERVGFTLAEQLAKLQNLAKKSLSVEALADAMGRSPAWIARRLQLLKLTEAWRNALKQNALPQLTTAHLEVIAKFNTPQQDGILGYLQRYDGQELCKNSSAKFEKELLAKFTIALKDLPWEENGCGQCPACLERLNGGYLFDDMNQAVCMDREYINARRREYVMRQAAEHPGAILVSHDYSKPKANPDNPDDPLNPDKIIESRYWSPAWKDDGQTAVVADGPEAGKVIQVTLSSDYRAPAEDGEPRVKPLAERKAAKRKQRERWAIGKLIDFINSPECPAPERSVLMVLVAGKGAKSAASLRYACPKGSDLKLKNMTGSVLNYTALAKRDDLDTVIWHTLKPLIVDELQTGQSGPEAACSKEAVLMSALLNFDLKAALKQSIIELPDPACWAKEEAQAAKAQPNEAAADESSTTKVA